MKLLMVIPYYWPSFSRGGPVVSLHCLNKALVRKGIDVTVYTTNVDLGIEVPVNCEVDIEGVKVNYFSFSRLFGFITPFGWQFSWRLTQALKENLASFDLVYIATVWRYPTVIAAYYSRRYRKPYVVAPRGMLYPEVFSKKLWKKWLFYKLFLKDVILGSSALHYTTDDEAQKTQAFLNLNNRKIIVPNGIELFDFPLSINGEKFKTRYPYLKDKKVILFLGRLNWKKGLDILIKAFARLIKERTDAHLLIVGPDELGYINRVKRWVRQYGMNYVDYGTNCKEPLKDIQVTFTGMLTGKQKLEAYMASDIFVLPSYSENFGMTVVEALSLGLAVIISNKVGVYRQIEQSRAGIVIDTQAQSLYEAIKLLLENPDLRKEIGINGRKLVEEYYNIEIIAEKMREAFKKILG
jgi:glycosyltransferase involved in cell wall biosynthesis